MNTQELTNTIVKLLQENNHTIQATPYMVGNIVKVDVNISPLNTPEVPTEVKAKEDKEPKK